MVVFIKYFWRKSVSWDKKETFNSAKLWLRLYKKGNHRVRVNSKNEKHFSRRVNIEVCELLQVLRSRQWKVLWKISALGILKHNNNLKST